MKNLEKKSFEPLREKYLPLLSEACKQKFSDRKEDPQNFKDQLIKISAGNSETKLTSEIIDSVINEGKLERFTDLLRPLKFFDLMDLDSNRKLKVIDQKDLENFDQDLKSFFKVTFGADGNPNVTALDEDKIWSEQGMNSEKPFVVINPGNGPANKREQLKGSSQFEKGLIYEVKLFEKGVKKSEEPRQYLVALNETYGGANFDLISEHNQNPDGFSTAHTRKQVQLIYGPLIAQDGLALPDAKIVENLSKARSFNASFGTVTANCQNNALVQMMRDLNIAPETIKEGVEGMRRFDCANVAKVSESKDGVFPSTVIFEGSNDKAAQDLIGGAVPPLPTTHEITNMSVVPIGEGNRIKVYQTLPIEVYNPAKKSTDEQKRVENMIVTSVPTIFETLDGSKPLALSERNDLLPKLGLGDIRFKDPAIHSPPHLTMPETPGNEVEGRDPDLLYKLIYDMMTRPDAKNVSHYFDQQLSTTPAIKSISELTSFEKGANSKLSEQLPPPISNTSSENVVFPPLPPIIDKGKNSGKKSWIERVADKSSSENESGHQK
jgi:hypothetical protein